MNKEEEREGERVIEEDREGPNHDLPKNVKIYN